MDLRSCKEERDLLEMVLRRGILVAGLSGLAEARALTAIVKTNLEGRVKDGGTEDGEVERSRIIDGRKEKVLLRKSASRLFLACFVVNRRKSA